MSLKSCKLIGIKEAVSHLKLDGVVGIPTETVYGLAGSIYSETAIHKIFALKERPFFDPLIVHVSELSQIAGIAVDSEHEVYKLLAQHFWPGPLTIIFEKKESVNPLITSGLNTVAVRMPNHPIAIEIINKLGQPIAMPSANKFGKTSPTTARHVLDSFMGSDLSVVDGGESQIGLESTVIRVNFRNTAVSVDILRPGFITRDDIRRAIPSLEDIEIIHSTQSPGHVEHHYMPDKPLVIIPYLHDKNLDRYLKKASQDLKQTFFNTSILNLGTDPILAARELYSKLRSLGEGDTDIIFIPEPPSRDGVWEAIWDRINRAKSLQL